jgi:hypothetical protein
VIDDGLIYDHNFAGTLALYDDLADAAAYGERACVCGDGCDCPGNGGKYGLCYGCALQQAAREARPC